MKTTEQLNENIRTLVNVKFVSVVDIMSKSRIDKKISKKNYFFKPLHISPSPAHTKIHLKSINLSIWHSVMALARIA